MRTNHWGQAGIVAAVLIGTLLIAGCPPPGGGGRVAGVIGVGGAASGVIAIPHQRHRYNLSIPYPQTVTIHVAGYAFDPMVRLIRVGGGVLGVNDDGGGGLNAQLVMTLAPGNYVVEVFGFGASTGSYTLTVQ